LDDSLVSLRPLIPSGSRGGGPVQVDSAANAPLHPWAATLIEDPEIKAHWPAMVEALRAVQTLTSEDAECGLRGGSVYDPVNKENYKLSIYTNPQGITVVNLLNMKTDREITLMVHPEKRFWSLDKHKGSPRLEGEAPLPRQHVKGTY